MNMEIADDQFPSLTFSDEQLQGLAFVLNELWEAAGSQRDDRVKPTASMNGWIAAIMAVTSGIGARLNEEQAARLDELTKFNALEETIQVLGAAMAQLNEGLSQRGLGGLEGWKKGQV